MFLFLLLTCERVTMLSEAEYLFKKKHHAFILKVSLEEVAGTQWNTQR